MALNRSKKSLLSELQFHFLIGEIFLSVNNVLAFYLMVIGKRKNTISVLQCIEILCAVESCIATRRFLFIK